jgi:NADH-quinone oxidoreductase subunit L
VFWAGLLIAALGTAFYMWRLYFLVFSGEARSDAAKGAHESPFSMTGPLIVLAILATLAGFIGFPHFKSFHPPGIMHALPAWLAPSVAAEWNDPPDKEMVTLGHPQSRLAIDLARTGRDALCCCTTPNSPVSRTMTVSACAAKGGTAYCTASPTKACTLEGVSDTRTGILALIALAIGGLGILGAWLLYGRGPSRTVDRLVVGPLGPLYEASKAKLWFDEIYDKIIVRPFKIVARGLFEVVDRFVIDTVAVNGTAFVIGLFGRISRWIQNGQVQRYLVGIVIGAALVFLVSRCRHEPSFEFTFEDNFVRLKAAPGEGVSSMAKIEWDVDSNGTIDLVGSEVQARRGEVGKVTMWIEDPISRERIRVTRVVRAASGAPAEGSK